MLIEFRVGNYLSFKSVTTFSMVAANIKEYHDSNVFTAGKHELLKSAAIYGANASGKSNLLKAMSTMRYLVTFFSKSGSTDGMDITPFLLNTETENEPSLFEITISIDGIIYRYGFEVTSTEVKMEWLYETKNKKEKLLFIRENDTIEVTKDFKEGKGLEQKTRDNALFLSVVDQFNGEISKKLLAFFITFSTIGLNHWIHLPMTFIANVHQGERIKKLISHFNLGFENFEIKDLKGEVSLPTHRELRKELILSYLKGEELFDIKTTHKKYDSYNSFVSEVNFDLQKQESTGTNKIFNITGALFWILSFGGVLIVDEIESSLHPLLTLQIIKLFNSVETNPTNAQLIFATHDTNILTYGRLRRDQIYFVEKDEYGASDLYSLAEFVEEDGGKVRNDRSYESDYIKGRYGAIPFIGDFSSLIK